MRIAMKKHLALVLVVAVALSASYAAARFRLLDRVKNTPILDVTRFIDLGSKDVGTDIEARFQIGNSGRVPLEVRDIKTNCGCRGLYLAGDSGRQEMRALTVQPFDSVELRMPFVVQGAPNTPRDLAVRFSTNDPANPDVELVIRVVPSSSCFAEPPSLNLANLGVGRPSCNSITLWGTENGSG